MQVIYQDKYPNLLSVINNVLECIKAYRPVLAPELHLLMHTLCRQDSLKKKHTLYSNVKIFESVK